MRPLKAYETPRALDRSEIPGVVAAYRKGAENAQRAGFDGVEIHGANGYLLDQFLQDKTNHRTDDYGGSIENRARLMLEVTDVCIAVWGAGRVGLHLAPRRDAHDVGDSTPAETFGHVAREAARRRIGFLCGGPYIVNEDFSADAAQAALDAGEADAVAFGKMFIANPDLPDRLRLGADLNPQRKDLFYTPGPEGYVDYPALGRAA